MELIVFREWSESINSIIIIFLIKKGNPSPLSFWRERLFPCLEFLTSL